MEDGHEMNQIELAHFQGKVSRAIFKAVEKVTIQDISSITHEEVQAMQEAMKTSVAKTGYSPELIAKFQKALALESNHFFVDFNSIVPAYLYVQEEDWRWLYAIHPNMRNATVLDQEQVGSRDVLLVSNAAGIELLEATE